MNKTLLVMIGSIVGLVGMIYLLSRDPNGRRESSILLYCAASNRAVIEEIRDEYERETGRKVDIQYGPSQTLLSQIEVSGSGDLYLPADDSYLELARAQQRVAEVLPLAKMRVVLAVPKGNPKQIDTLQDLLSEETRLVQASFEAAAVGKLTKRKLTEQGLWDRLDAATDAYRSTVTDVANDVMVGAADVGIVYDAVLHTYPDLEYVEIPELADASSQVSVGVVAGSRQPADALHFARYLSAVDRGLPKYAAHGFQVAGGDVWSDLPELSIYAGSMLRPAIEDTIVEFEQREGVRVSRVYNGCGILVSQMKAGQQPDAYFACDSEFMNQVVDLFPEPVPVSENELVILVQKGNPKGIASLRDLTKPGLRVGIGHEKQCAMGWITQNTLREGGIQQEVMANVTVQTPTGDMLVNQLKTGSLDAAVVYLSNAAGSGEVLDAVQIQGLACSIATQPWAVQKDSKYPALAGRLFEQIISSGSQDRVAAEGFRWQYATSTEPTIQPPSDSASAPVSDSASSSANEPVSVE